MIASGQQFLCVVSFGPTVFYRCGRDSIATMPELLNLLRNFGPAFTSERLIKLKLSPVGSGDKNGEHGSSPGSFVLNELGLPVHRVAIVVKCASEIARGHAIASCKLGGEVEVANAVLNIANGVFQHAAVVVSQVEVVTGFYS